MTARRYMGERMAFPWELNLDRPYRDEKWPCPELRARRGSTDSVVGGSAEKLDGFPADSENRQGTAEGSDPESPGKCKPRLRTVIDHKLL
jgi:hypothetical protein